MGAHHHGARDRHGETAWWVSPRDVGAVRWWSAHLWHTGAQYAAPVLRDAASVVAWVVSVPTVATASMALGMAVDY